MENGNTPKQAEPRRELRKPTEEIAYFPSSPEFFGDKPNFSQKVKRGLFRTGRKVPNLSELRSEMNSDLSKDPIRNQKLRQDINKLITRFPSSEDLQALKAIQSYQDVQQSGLSDQKFAIIESIVQNLGRAINTHAYSLNNLFWFLKIFLHYLELFQKRLLTGHPVKDVSYADAKRQLSVLHIQTKKSIRDFDILNSNYEKTSFNSESVTTAEVIAAYHAIRKGNEKLPVGKFQRPAIIVQIIHLKINVILSRFPIFAPIIEQNLSATAGIIHRDVYLMNGMISLNQLLNEYYLIKATANKELQKSRLSDVVHKCNENISFLQDNQTLSKEFEYDSLLKFAILTLEVWKNPFAMDYKSSMLTQARSGLFKIINRSYNQIAIRQANRFFNEFDAHCNPESQPGGPVFRSPARDLFDDD
jgi:hypothetical protein